MAYHSCPRRTLLLVVFWSRCLVEAVASPTRGTAVTSKRQRVEVTRGDPSEVALHAFEVGRICRDSGGAWPLLSHEWTQNNPGDTHQDGNQDWIPGSRGWASWNRTGGTCSRLPVARRVPPSGAAATNPGSRNTRLSRESFLVFFLGWASLLELVVSCLSLVSLGVSWMLIMRY